MIAIASSGRFFISLMRAAATALCAEAQRP